jgi:hypothetical protein
MASKTKTTLEYSKEELIAALKDALARREEALNTFDKDLAKWRETAPAKFLAAVEAYDPAKPNYFLDFGPPHRPQACSDWKMKDLNHEIARIGLVHGDIVKLRNDDSIFTYIGEGPCE